MIEINPNHDKVMIKSRDVIINDSTIMDSDNRCVMEITEKAIMIEQANQIAFKGADILELGFGMGLSALAIQNHKPKSHTIVEAHPKILKKLYEWAKDRPSVKVIEGYWHLNIDLFEQYDGIFFDTYRDPYDKQFFANYELWLNPGGKFTFYNPDFYGRVPLYFKDNDKLELIKTKHKIYDYYIPILTKSL